MLNQNWQILDKHRNAHEIDREEITARFRELFGCVEKKIVSVLGGF